MPPKSSYIARSSLINKLNEYKEKLGDLSVKREEVRDSILVTADPQKAACMKEKVTKLGYNIRNCRQRIRGIESEIARVGDPDAPFKFADIARSNANASYSVNEFVSVDNVTQHTITDTEYVLGNSNTTFSVIAPSGVTVMQSVPSYLGPLSGLFLVQNHVYVGLDTNAWYLVPISNGFVFDKDTPRIKCFTPCSNPATINVGIVEGKKIFVPSPGCYFAVSYYDALFSFIPRAFPPATPDK